MDVCISDMLYEYHPYLENLQISSFTRLVEASTRTSMSVKKFSKVSTSQWEQPWRRKGKKVELTMAEEPKEAAKGKEGERSGIPPLFTLSTEEFLVIGGCGFGSCNVFVMGIWLCFVLSWAWDGGFSGCVVVLAMVVG